MSKFLKYKDVINLLVTVLIYISICNFSKISCFSIISFGIFIIIYMIVKKNFLKNINKENIILSLIFTIFFSLGRVCYQNMYSKDSSILLEFISPINLFLSVGLFLFINLIISIILNKLVNLKIIESKKMNNKKVFIVSFIGILICWIPYFLSAFPGYIAPDSVNQIKQFNNIIPLTDHHPVLHTMFIKFFYKFGSLFSNSENVKLSFATIAQMTIMAFIYAYFITFLSKHKINKKILIFLVLLFGLLPVFAFYSLMMWKDVLFGGFFLLFLIIIYNMIDRKENLKIYDFVSFSIVSLLLLFFRNNAVYMYFIIIPFFLLFFKKRIFSMLVSFFTVLLCFYVVKYPIYNSLKIERSESWEYLGMPIQQVGRMAYKNVKFTKNEKNKIEKFMKIEDLKNDYNPILSDGIKFSLNMNQDYFRENSKEFIILWKDLVIKHPTTAVESYMVSTLGYWYPDLQNNAVENKVTENDINVYNHSFLPKKITKFINNLYNYNIPILSWQWNIGFVIWIIIITGVICFKKNKKYILCYLPVFGMWVTLMLASPVNGMLRYVFWAYTSLPLLFFINYFKINNKV